MVVLVRPNRVHQIAVTIYRRMSSTLRKCAMISHFAERSWSRARRDSIVSAMPPAEQSGPGILVVLLSAWGPPGSCPEGSARSLRLAVTQLEKRDNCSAGSRPND
jgi:hypothetical protein